MNQNNVHQAREVLGARLRELRQLAGLTGKEFAKLLGWQATKISKIELGKQTPTSADITAWAGAIGADDIREELLATLHSLELQYAEWRRVLRSGTHVRQQSQAEREAKTTHIRVFESTIFPGLLQTAGYAQCMLADGVGLFGSPDDLADGVQARMRRQEILYQRGKRFHFVLSEAVLRYRPCPPDVLAGQLDRLLALTSLHALRIGVVPFEVRTPVPPLHGFWIYDDSLVQVETFAAELNLVQPWEIQFYTTIFDRIAARAAYGAGARALITRAVIDLADQAGSTG